MPQEYSSVHSPNPSILNRISFLIAMVVPCTLLLENCLSLPLLSCIWPTIKSYSLNRVSTLSVELSEIKDKVLKDWKKTKRKEKILDESKNNLNFFHELSDLHNLTIKEAEIYLNSQELPTKLISDIFEADKGSVVELFEENKVYIAIITDITMPKSINEIKELSLQNDLRVSFGTELLKNKKISTNDKLIDAVINNF